MCIFSGYNGQEHSQTYSTTCSTDIMYVFLYPQAKGLHFKHTDNFNFWLRSLSHVGLPKVGEIVSSLVECVLTEIRALKK